MGLEIVELILRAEEEFGIEIRDEEAEQLATPGALSRLISWKLGAFDAPGCLSSRTFYHTRRVLVDLTQTPRAEIRPRTPLGALLPVQNRRELWSQLGRQLHAENALMLPDLLLPEPLHGAIVLGVTVPWTLSFACFAAGEAAVSAALLAGGAAYLWLAFVLTKPLARRFPASCQSAGQLSQWVLVSGFRQAPAPTVVAPTVPAPTAGVGEGEIWKRVQAMVADDLGVALEMVTPDADFVRDLGVG